MKSEESPIFIVGCGHSGTSLLLKILGAHSRICAIPFESNFAFKWPEPCEKSRRFFAHCATFTERMGKARWLEKTPTHIFKLKEILRHFPEAKILLLLRDGRDVVYSFQERYGNLEAGLRRWVEGNEAGRSYWEHPQVQVVRYENLVTDFEKTIREVMKFIGEEFEESMCHYYETRTYYFGSQIEKPSNAFGENHAMYRNWQMNQPLFDGRGKWHRLTDEEKRQVKERIGNMLIQYGYAADLNW